MSDEIRDAASESAKQGGDLRGRVHDLTLEALKTRRFDREAIRDAHVVGRVAIDGYVPDAARALAGFDVALYPPLESDGMSRALLESLAAGRPVVASRVGLAAEVITDGETGLLVPAGDAEALAAAIDRLLADPALCLRLGRAGRALVEGSLSGERLAGRLAALYAELARPA